jgi:IPT/TIG domain
MTGFRERKTWIVFIAVLLLFAACKGETPTAPPTGGGTPPGTGTTPPPSGVDVQVTVSSQNPVVDSTVTITATVTENGQPVANGTAVEFTTNSPGVLEGGGTSIVRTTTNGVATTTLTSASVATVRVFVTVNNVSRQVDVNFVARPIVPTPPNTNPTITSVTPNIGRPAGGEIIRITGTNFRGPVRVLFRFAGQALPVEASIVSATETTIDVVTPPVNLGVGQQLVADIIVITQVGTASENRAESTGAFTFRSERLTPVLFSVTPNSGPVIGGTRVTLIGEGFQEPVQVLFDTAEARVLKVEYNQILVETPAARDTPPTGSGTVTGAVNVTVRNLTSQTTSTLTAGFNYKADMQITAAGPASGLYTGGTRVTIDGVGFVPPVTVTVAGIPATVISAVGSRIVIQTPAVQIDGCTNVEGPIVVTNVVNGDQAIGPAFEFIVPPPFIVNVTPPVATAGTTASITVTVANAQPGVNRIQLGDKTVFPTSVTFNPDGTANFIVPLPTNFEFPTEACPGGGERFVPVELDVTYTNANTDCTDTATEALTVNPPSSACVAPPEPQPAVTFSPTNGACVAPSAVVGTTNTGATITFTNTGDAPLNVTASAPAGTSAAEYVITPPTRTNIPGGGTGVFNVAFTPAGVGTRNATVTFTTNDPDAADASIVVCLQGTGQAPPP